MSLRALPQDLCTPLRRQVPRPPRLAGRRRTGSKTELSGPFRSSDISGRPGLLAVAGRQIRQKRRMLHWRRAHQLSLCINDADFLNRLQRFEALRHAPHPANIITDLGRSTKALLQDFIIHLVAVRTELNQLNDAVGVLTINADILYLTRSIRNANHPDDSLFPN